MERTTGRVASNHKTAMNGTAGKQAKGRVELSSGLKFERRHTKVGADPFDQVKWELRSAVITNEKGEVVFEQKDVEFPTTWSQMATNVVVSKYFRGPLGSPERETSLKQVIGRVADTITEWSRKARYFATDDDVATFHDELTYLLLHQRMAFNSPVWFNIGVPGVKQQASACFINSVEDKMESILGLAKTEGMLFKFGSGTGTNFSTLRSSKEQLSGGGIASGPVSFMKGFDAFAGVIKSGGTTRRAAKMVILNIDHPDIDEFIECKVKEERKAWALIDAGYDPSFTGEAYSSIFFQNANHSVRVTDEFMKAVEEDKPWELHAIVDGRVVDTIPARKLMRSMAESAWQCGDPGIQYDTVINDWHTSPKSGRINASNPCFTGDTLVSTDKGLVSFADLLQRVQHGERFRVYTYEATGKAVEARTLALAIGGPVVSGNVERGENAANPVELTEPEAYMITGHNRVVRLQFSNGMEVRCTPNHRFFTKNRGYVRADELMGNDEVHTLDAPTPPKSASYELPVSSDPASYQRKGDHHLPLRLPLRWTREFAHYLGWLIGDGSASSEQTVVTTYGNSEDQEAVMPRHQQLVALINGGKAPRISVQRNGTAQVRLSRRPFVAFVRALGVGPATASGKRTPWSINEAPHDIAAAFLRGLFDADGCARDGGDKGRYIGLGSRSHQLVLDVQRLLTTFGIHSRIYQTSARSGSFSYVRRDGAQVTYQSGETAYDLRISAESMAIFAQHIGFSIPSKQRTLETILSKGRYHTDTTVRMTEREDAGIELTYNLTEPRNHSYIANGLVVSNCSEYMYLDDTACNLASLNLMKFLDEDGSFNVDDYRHAVRTTITAQEALVSFASYPTETIAQNSERYRTLGLGYANLGAMLMARGVAYDSDEGRALAGAVTALMTGEAYAQSARIAKEVGAFAGYSENRTDMLRVIGKHREAAYKLPTDAADPLVVSAARKAWDEAHEVGAVYGYRNAQTTVLAPTGTIGFMLDCDTTGVEPDIALVKYKKLVGGGMLKMVNMTVPRALKRLGYDENAVKQILDFIDKNDTIEGAPGLREEDVKVFDCAFRPANGERSIAWQGHVLMMAAAQPFISGAISKTVNMPATSTVDDIENAYIQGWKLGLKALAIYRDGSKRSQPMATSIGKTTGEQVKVVERPLRRRLPQERVSITHRFEVSGHEGYITVGLYDDGTPGEVFLRMAKEGSTISGLMDAFALTASLALQYGVPLKALVNKWSHTRFDPQGFTGNPEIPIAKSIMDYIGKWMGSRFLGWQERDALGIIRRDGSQPGEEPLVDTRWHVEATKPASQQAMVEPTPYEPQQLVLGEAAQGESTFENQVDAPSCSDCGAIMVRNGACYKCMNCGATSGCS